MHMMKRELDAKSASTMIGRQKASLKLEKEAVEAAWTQCTDARDAEEQRAQDEARAPAYAAFPAMLRWRNVDKYSLCESVDFHEPVVGGRGSFGWSRIAI